MRHRSPQNAPLIALWLVVVCLLSGSVAFAQDATPTAVQPSAPDDDSKKEASAHFRRGVELFQEGAYRAALVEFERAYEIAPDYRLLYNIGQTKLQIQDYLGATQSYERYLTEGGGEVPQARREDVEKALEALRERVGRIAIAANREGAEVMIDDLKVGSTPLAGTIAVNVGRHRVIARTPDGANDTEVIDVAGGDIVDVKLELTAPEVKQTVLVAEETSKPWSGLKKTAVVGWALGGALMVGGGVTGFLAQGEADDLDKLLKKPGVKASEVNSKRDSAKSMALTTDVLIGTGIALAVAGTVCWFLDDGDDAEQPEDKAQNTANLEWDVGLGTLTARGHF